MAILDNILGIDEIEEQETRANEAARERFDPSVLQPQFSEARERAVEGISDDPIRGRLINRIFGNTNMNNIAALSGGNQARAISFAERQNQQRQQAMSDAETNISIQEDKAQREGRMQAAEIRSQQNQIRQQREAKIKENRLMAEAEAERRRKQFGTKIGKLVGLGASAIPGVGPALSAGIGIGGGALFGGGEGATAGGITGLGASLNLGSEQTEQTEGISAGEVNLANVFGNLGEENTMDFAEGLMQTPTSQEEEQGKVTLRDILNL